MSAGLEQNSRCGGVPAVPVHIVAALEELTELRFAAGRMPETSAAERAVRAARIALIEARQAGWYGVLARWTFLGSGFPHVYGRVACAARTGCRASARFWRNSAATSRARAERGERS